MRIEAKPHTSVSDMDHLDQSNLWEGTRIKHRTPNYARQCLLTFPIGRSQSWNGLEMRKENVLSQNKKMFCK